MTVKLTGIGLPNVTVEVCSLPKVMDVRGYTIDMFGGLVRGFKGESLSVEVFTEGMSVTLRMADGNVVHVPNFRLRSLQGDMLPVWCASQARFRTFISEKLDKAL